MCGEKFSQTAKVGYIPGSPPHVRGKVLAAMMPTNALGITPACAGKRHLLIRKSVEQRDHPRMCGEKRKAGSVAGCADGSPPHVRGKETRSLQQVNQTGITPACAGKRLKRSRSTVPPAAIVPPFPSVCNKLVVSDGSLAERDAPLFLPAENTAPASPTYNLRSL